MAVRFLVDRKPAPQVINDKVGGQSNSMGEQSQNMVSLTQPYNNLRTWDDAYGEGLYMLTTPGGGGVRSFRPL
ncbi:MAG: hypothetical protein ABIP54_00625, partial [Candidatus Andersenbacteria bacterium]